MILNKICKQYIGDNHDKNNIWQSIMMIFLHIYIYLTCNVGLYDILPFL